MNLRAYTFTNFMLNSVAQGIQPAHCLMDMLRFYQKNADQYPKQARMVENWADYHKTMICLNGGNYANMVKLYGTIGYLADYLELPHMKFSEDMDTLHGTMTCCGIIVPDSIYVTARERLQDLTATPDVNHSIDPMELTLAATLSEYSLAR